MWLSTSTRVDEQVMGELCQPMATITKEEAATRLDSLVATIRQTLSELGEKHKSTQSLLAELVRETTRDGQMLLELNTQINQLQLAINDIRNENEQARAIESRRHLTAKTVTAVASSNNDDTLSPLILKQSLLANVAAVPNHSHDDNRSTHMLDIDILSVSNVDPFVHVANRIQADSTRSALDVDQDSTVPPICDANQTQKMLIKTSFYLILIFLMRQF